MNSFGENVERIALNTSPVNQFDMEIGIVQGKCLSMNLEKERIRKFKSKTDRYRSNTILRVVFSAVYTLVLVYWLCNVLDILRNNSYKLSDSVLISLLITSTANVIGMVVIVLKNLFPGKSERGKRMFV
ncbi:hypothetical protein [Flavobacterium cerinum]|uniref:Uncharacterized protein n=1 Tax=Flavobacterium cerinum TaxID=2502784 RepID=A0ABY5IS62_9FLAO|nr:hypothetical protein [Flavobacterium cerinum]UUC45110.1 hypothetical protein NOX80_15975 [Flavobacterium cerinum]